MHKTLLGDMAILRNHCVVTSQCLQLCKQNLYQLFICSLAITEWVYTFLIPKICPVLSSFFRAGNNITGDSNRVGGGLNIIRAYAGGVVIISKRLALTNLRHALGPVRHLGYTGTRCQRSVVL